MPSPLNPDATSRSLAFVQIQKRGTVAIPKALRERHHLDEPGAQVEFIEREDGVIEMHPHLPRRVDQAWFWTEEWQRRERESDEDFAAGRHVVTDNVDDFLAELDR